MGKAKTRIDKKTGREVWFCKATIADLGRDPSYQRGVKRKHALIAMDFDPAAFSAPTIGIREDGSKWIVDGLQRITALIKMGVKTVYVKMFASAGPEDEARVWKKLNMDRTNTSWPEKFKALLSGQDETAWRIKRAVEECGFKVDGHRFVGRGEASDKHITCISTLFVIDRRDGVGALKFALRVLEESWPADRLRTHNTLIEGLAIFYRRHEEVVDEIALVDRLRTVAPNKVMGAAQMTLLSGTQGEAVAAQIERVYKKRIAGSKKSK